MIIDTSVLIDILRGKLKPIGDAISIISVMEVLRALDGEKRVKVFEELKNTYTIYPIDEKVALEYAELYSELKKKGRLVSDLDLLIASTAKAYNEKVLTKDKDFLNLKEYIEIITL